MNAEQHRILVALEQGARLEQALGDDESWVLENEWLDPAAPETLYRDGLIQPERAVVGYWFTSYALTEVGRAVAVAPHTPTLWERVKGWLGR